jgi:hypothetical protein
MSDYDYIKWILNEDYLVKGPHKLTMREDKGPDLSVHEVKIDVCGGMNVAVYRFDIESKKDHLPFFRKGSENSPKSLTKFCDYIILVEKEFNLTIFLIEMKRGTTDGYKKQIQAAEYFMQYILSSAERVKDDNDMPNFNAQNIGFRKVLIRQTMSNKELTKKSEMEKIKKTDSIIELRCYNKFRIHECI